MKSAPVILGFQEFVPVVKFLNIRRASKDNSLRHYCKIIIKLFGNFNLSESVSISLETNMSGII